MTKLSDLANKFAQLSNQYSTPVAPGTNATQPAARTQGTDPAMKMKDTSENDTAKVRELLAKITKLDAIYNKTLKLNGNDTEQFLTYLASNTSTDAQKLTYISSFIPRINNDLNVLKGIQ